MYSYQIITIDNDPILQRGSGEMFEQTKVLNGEKFDFFFFAVWRFVLKILSLGLQKWEILIWSSNLQKQGLLILNLNSSPKFLWNPWYQLQNDQLSYQVDPLSVWILNTILIIISVSTVKRMWKFNRRLIHSDRCTSLTTWCDRFSSVHCVWHQYWLSHRWILFLHSTPPSCAAQNPLPNYQGT